LGSSGALAKARTLGDSVRATKVSDEGASFVTAPDDIRIQTRDGVFLVSRNGRGELAQVPSSAKATWYQEAFEIFLSGVTPWLDHLSYLSDAPLVVDILVKMDHPSGSHDASSAPRRLEEKFIRARLLEVARIPILGDHADVWIPPRD
jgi:hypothetical protein